MKSRPKLVVGGLALVVAMTGGAFAAGYSASGGSTDPGATPDPVETVKARQVAASSPLPAFDDCDALKERMAHLTLPYVDEWGLRGSPKYDAVLRGDVFPMSTAGAPSMDAPAAAAADAGAAAADTSAAAAPMSSGATAKSSTKAAKAAAAPKAARAAAGESAGAGGQNDRTVDASRPIDKAGVTVDSGHPASEGVSTKSGSRAADGDDPDAAVGPGETGTNLQEKDVDEPDTAKTDGRLVVSLSGSWLRVVDVSGDEPVHRGSLNLWELGVRPEELLLSGHRALVFGTVARHQGPMAKPTKERDWYSPAAGLALVDLSNPDSPRVLSTERITGKHVSARMTGDTVRVVVSSSPDLAFVAPGSNRGSRESAEEFNRDVVERASAEDWRPTRIIWDGSGARASEPTPLVDCKDVRYPTVESGVDMLSVLTMDLGNDDALSHADSTAIVAAGDLVYASQDRLYVATTEGGWGRFAIRREQDKASTQVHEFDISGSSDTPYRSSGTVSGYIPGRWAMDSFDGDLRVVTTTRRPWEDWNGGQSVSNIVVLRPQKDRLVEVGHVTGMGNNETVRSVRWFDELAVVVTFRQQDPLYLVDMSEPERPVVRGELKIPGYSAYMHPIGDHRLLGVGQDADQWGGERALQVSSFDIADADHPRRTDAVTWSPYSHSAVETDPRTFVYLPDRGMALMPASLREFRFRPGLVSVRVSADGDLRKGAQWYGGRYGGVNKIISLPDGRMAAIERSGITVLDTDDLTVRGSTAYDG